MNTASNHKLDRGRPGKETSYVISLSCIAFKDGSIAFNTSYENNLVSHRKLLQPVSTISARFLLASSKSVWKSSSSHFNLQSVYITKSA